MTPTWFAAGEFARTLDERLRTAERDLRRALDLGDHDGAGLAEAVLEDLRRLGREAGLGA